MIVKIQRSLERFPPGPELMLVYDENMDFKFQEDMTPEVREALKGRPKAYFSIDYSELSGEMTIIKEVEPQNW